MDPEDNFMRGGFVDGQSDVIACVAPREACQGLNDSRLAKFQSFKVVNWPDSGSTKAGSFQNPYNQVIFWEYLLGSPSSQLMLVLMLLAWKGGRL